MPNKILWNDPPTSRGTVLASELNSLANGALSGVSGSGTGSPVDNATNLDQYGLFRLSVTFGSNPSAGGSINVYEIIAADGSTYGSSAAAVQMRLVCSIPVNASTSLQVIDTPPILLRPALSKYAIENKTGVAFPASGSTLTLFTANDEVQ